MMQDVMTGPVGAVSSPEQETEMARQSGNALAHLGAINVEGVDGRTLHLRLEDRQTGARAEATVPGAVVRLLADALAQMAQGKAVTLMPQEAELSVQQAAERLGVSRVYFLKLLEQGALPSQTVGGLRRVRATDLAAYVASYQRAAHDALDVMTAEAQRLALYE